MTAWPAGAPACACIIFLEPGSTLRGRGPASSLRLWGQERPVGAPGTHLGSVAPFALVKVVANNSRR